MKVKNHNSDYKEKVIVIYDSIPFFVPFFWSKGFPTFPTLKKISNIQKAFRKVCFHLNIFEFLWYGDWKKKLNEIDTIIIFASTEPLPIKFIQEKYPQIRIIFWYWNPVFKLINPNDISNYSFEKWSFDPIDCKEYSLKFNTTFYFNTIKLPKAEIKYDLTFVGVDKGRKKALIEIEKEMLKQDLKPNFYIVDDKYKNLKSTNKSIAYLDYLKLISQSKAILDFVQKGQNGLTLRPMESIFFKKKLVTNDPTIKHQDFYDSDNIFILGIDDSKSLKSFLNSPYKKISDSIIEKYDCQKWMKRFLLTKNE
ncbi:hypothetical protein [Flavimarina sp. Hel_I_48]|uniref:hypothetical protein n=1 Tax=Flavimarina sp. Hel_I_48 TaxID=1392488 RepID=UPI000689847D|nr:hypothetical protein [Flavimarina sp. Hel_I_48]